MMSLKEKQECWSWRRNTCWSWIKLTLNLSCWIWRGNKFRVEECKHVEAEWIKKNKVERCWSWMHNVEVEEWKHVEVAEGTNVDRQTSAERAGHNALGGDGLELPISTSRTLRAYEEEGGGRGAKGQRGKGELRMVRIWKKGIHNTDFVWMWKGFITDEIRIKTNTSRCGRCGGAQRGVPLLEPCVRVRGPWLLPRL